MDVEDVARVSLPAGGPAQKQAKLAVGGGMLGQVVVDDERVHGVVAEVLAHCAPCVRSDELQGRRFAGVGRDHNGVVHRAVFFQGVDHLGHGGRLLADGDVDAVDVGVLLIDNRVDR